MSEQMIKNVDVFLEKMTGHGITKYQLVKLSGIAQGTVYFYLNGKNKIPAAICKVFADAIGEEAVEAFPELRIMGPELADVADGDYDPGELKERVLRPAPDEDGHKPITLSSMMAGSAMLFPEDGFTLKSRKVMDSLFRDFEALSVQNEQQVTVKTGIKTCDLDLDKLAVKGFKKHVLEHELRVDPFPFDIDGELCFAVYVHGKALMICRGMEVGKLMFRK